MSTGHRSLIWLVIVGWTTLGFRPYPGAHSYPVDNSSSANSKVFVVYTNAADTVTNDLPTDDTLGAGTLTVSQIMDSVFTDYNSIGGSFLTLVDTSDSDYSVANAENRTLTIQFGNSFGNSTGEARPTWDGDSIVGCTITARSSILDSAKEFVAIMTHEIGHCLGLDHPQESNNAIMSYFRSEDMIRLQIDDKMGITYLYPQDSEANKESPTLGLTCARK
ncbi:MAG: matrixin family metalloprotease [Pseudobdellovibrionaceae bacterium]|nr:matrixin family metalloprotease [Bdellovibrionales bacterium]USN47655.1 MAG: matrixin family metalloprotease [Pseudobdellovibrionaceae bacterium]